jgi:hypothetical protein
MLLCGFSYQAAQVLADDIMCAVCEAASVRPGKDAIVVVPSRCPAWSPFSIYACSRLVDLSRAGHFG